jgi:ribosomal protein S13
MNKSNSITPNRPSSERITIALEYFSTFITKSEKLTEDENKRLQQRLESYSNVLQTTDSNLNIFFNHTINFLENIRLYKN